MLLQAAASQVFSDGVMAEMDGCARIRALKELIRVVNNSYLGMDDVSVFDSLPFLTDPYEDTAVFNQAQAKFMAMIEAKRPDVVISRHQGGV